MVDLFARHHRLTPPAIARALERLRSEAGRNPGANADRDRAAGVDPRSVERARAMLGCAVRGVDPAPSAESSPAQPSPRVG
jgi:hypothetical protein